MTRRVLGFLVVVLSCAAIEARPVIVEFRGAGHLARFRRDLARPTLSTDIRFEYSTVFHGAALDLDDSTIARLRALPYVRAIHRDRQTTAFATNAAPADARQRVNATTLPTRGEGIVVAVVDTGIDYTHPALAGKVIRGYDFHNGDDDPMDDYGHGTHVAGIIAAESDLVTGVAPGATLIAFKVLGADGFGSTSALLAAIERCADPNGDGDTADRVDVANVSLGFPGHPDDPVSRAVDAATAAGVVFAIATGNTGGIKTVASPAAARTAIAVGAEWLGTTAPFSAGGPTYQSLAFKPDVIAPGFGIVSTWTGGSLAVADGTSMAAPHVAGVAALLRKLHPEWTPAEVKAAIVSGAVSVPDIPFRGGAGLVDALRAHEARVLVSDAGVSFGIAPDAAGTFEATRSIVITNRGATEETFTSTSTMVTPSTFVLPAGASQTVDLTLRFDNAAQRFPESRVISGSVSFKNASTTLTVGWGVLRAARLTVRYDGGFLVSALTYADDDLWGAEPYDDALAEGLFTPGKKWDVLVNGTDGRFVAVEQREITGDMVLDVKASDATTKVALDARDERGLPLRELVGGTYNSSARVIHNGASLPYPLGVSELRLSPMTRFRIIPFESYVDGTRVYTAEHGKSAYVRGSVTWRRSSADENALSICGLTAFKPDELYFASSLNCIDKTLADEHTVEYFSTEETTLDGSGAMVLTSNTVALPLVRAREGELVISSEIKPSLAALRIPNGGGATVGIGPRHPWAFFGTSLHLSNANTLGFGYPAWGFTGAAGEIRHEVEAGTRWWLFDDEGKGVKQGDLAETWLQRLKLDHGYRFVARNDTFRVAGRTSRGELEMRYAASGSDLTPPTITSLRILDAAGRSTERVANGENASLLLAVADLHDLGAGNVRTLSMRTSRVFYRVAGSFDWKPLEQILERSETGTASALGHMPTGDTYRVDLSAATKNANAFIDLRIELEDSAGNTTTWTQSPVLMVGEVVSAPKRRSAR